MATRQKHSNNGTSTLLGGFAIGATSCSVQAGHGARFDSPGANEFFIYVLKDAAGNIEICKCTQRTTDTFNVVVRAQEGTTERDWLAGDLVEARLTRDTMGRLAQKDAAETITAPWTFSQAVTHSGNDIHSGNEKHTGSETFQGRVNAANTVGGTANDITATFNPTFTGALTDKARVTVRANAANTGAATFFPDAVTDGALPINKIVGGVLTALVAGDIGAGGHDIDLVYNLASDKWLLLNPTKSQAYIHLNDTKGNGVDGGTFTQGSWVKRDIAEISDPYGLCTVASSVITLAPGTYECHISCPATAVNAHISRLQNTSDNTTTLNGTSEFSNNTTPYATTCSVISGMFTITASKNFEIQHWCQASSAGSGLGRAANLGGASEVYTTAVFRRIEVP